jgi:hypothetical protein
MLGILCATAEEDEERSVDLVISGFVSRISDAHRYNMVPEPMPRNCFDPEDE